MAKHPEQLSEEERRDLAYRVRRAASARAFLAGEFWKSYLGPHFQDEERKCAEALLWRPSEGFPGTERLANQVVLNSGMKIQLVKLRQDLAIWVEEGEGALKKLKKDDENRRKR